MASPHLFFLICKYWKSTEMYIYNNVYYLWCQLHVKQQLVWNNIFTNNITSLLKTAPQKSHSLRMVIGYGLITHMFEVFTTFECFFILNFNELLSNQKSRHLQAVTRSWHVSSLLLSPNHTLSFLNKQINYFPDTYHRSKVFLH